MSSTEDFERLALQFRRATILPQLPGSAIQLLKMLEQTDATDPTLERIITSDPALAASIIRIASSAMYGSNKVTTIRRAMLRIGERSIKSLALSLAMQSMTHSVAKSSRFDPHRFSRHSLFVGMMASALHARMETTKGNLDWASEELLAIGILHDLHFGILARIAPETYAKAVSLAIDNGLPLDCSVEIVLGKPAHELAILMFETWGLPEIFLEATRALYHHPEDERDIKSSGALIAAQNLAKADFAIESWQLASTGNLATNWPLPPQDELDATVQVVRNEAEAFLQTTLAVAI